MLDVTYRERAGPQVLNIFGWSTCGSTVGWFYSEGVYVMSGTRRDLKVLTNRVLHSLIYN
jgi:hypothetical protein